jgi:hypothetical protein
MVAILLSILSGDLSDGSLIMGDVPSVENRGRVLNRKLELLGLHRVCFLVLCVVDGSLL